MIDELDRYNDRFAKRNKHLWNIAKDDSVGSLPNNWILVEDRNSYPPEAPFSARAADQRCYWCRVLQTRCTRFWQSSGWVYSEWATCCTQGETRLKRKCTCTYRYRYMFLFSFLLGTIVRSLAGEIAQRRYFLRYHDSVFPFDVSCPSSNLILIISLLHVTTPLISYVLLSVGHRR